MYYIIDVTLFTLTVMSICKNFVVKFDNRLVFSMNDLFYIYIYIYFWLISFWQGKWGREIQNNDFYFIIRDIQSIVLSLESEIVKTIIY